MISIGLATRNRPERLAQWVAHIQQLEGVADVPILIVDQSSQPTAMTLPDNVMYMHRPGSGLAIARNTLLHACQTTYLVVCDDDCLPDHDWVTVARRLVTTAPQVALWFGATYPTGADWTMHHAPTHAGTTPWASRPNGNVCLALRTHPTALLVQQPVAILEVLGQGNNMIIHVPTAHAVGGFETWLGAGARGRSGEDVEYALRLLCRQNICGYEPALRLLHDAWQTPDHAARAGHGYTVGMVAVHLWYAWYGVAVAVDELAFRFGLRPPIVGAGTSPHTHSMRLDRRIRKRISVGYASLLGVIIGCVLIIRRGVPWHPAR